MRNQENLIHKIIALLLVLLCVTKSRAQTNGPITLFTANTTGTYISNTSITLNPGFTSTVPFSASIQLIDCIPLATTPTQTQNYLITSTPRISGFTSETQLGGQGSCAMMQTIQYMDGLGRPVQTIQVMGSPFGNDVVQPQAYDQYGREATKYLPYAPYSGSHGAFRPNAMTTDQQAFYSNPPAGVTQMANPYAQASFDSSPLDRPTEQGAPGAAWQLSTSGITGSGHTMKMVYTLNNAITWASDSVNSRQAAFYYCTINTDNSRTLHNNGYYAASALTVTISKDENWTSGRAGTVEEYKDIDGQVILKRVYNYTGTTLQQISTYYVYDDLNKLAFVLTPASGADGAGTIAQTTLDNLCYQYQYDERGRMVQKKLPGKGWEYMVYNTMDQPVASQDANERASNQWIFTKYDAQQRAVETGIWNNGNIAITRASLQSTLTGITTNLYEAPITTGNGYTNVAWPTTSVTATLTLNYYDSYATVPGLPAAYSAPTGANLSTRGELTGTRTAVLNTPANMLWTAHYYDYLGRSIESYAQHYLAGTLNSSNYDDVNTTYDFSNAPTTVIRQHFTTASTTVPLLTVLNQYLYDHTGRKIKSWEQLTNGSSAPTTRTLISQTVYNEVGQTTTKNLHSTDSVNYLQSISYAYNERGWLTQSTAPLFQMQLQYNTGSSKQYNGNIAYQYWGTAASPNSYSYTYGYDKLNRLTGGTSSDSYKETGITYDLMGNITALNRYQAGTLIDQLTYTYSGNNQVQSITDASGSNTGLVSGTTTYSWDNTNGNLKTNTNTTNTAQNKTFTTYNLLNLPQLVTIATGTDTYTYDANGDKLRKVAVISGTTTTTDYISGIQYNNSTTAVGYIQTEEGQAVPNGTTFDYQYYLGDNLGNTRITFGTKTATAVQYQKDDYYPFGLEINRSVLSPKNEYLYNKKELQEELTQYDYGARYYDPLVARWMTVDPLAETSRRWSPYNYVENDPIRMTDPDGMSAADMGVVGSSGGDNGGRTTETAEEKESKAWGVAKSAEANNRVLEEKSGYNNDAKTEFSLSGDGGGKTTSRDHTASARQVLSHSKGKGNSILKKLGDFDKWMKSRETAPKGGYVITMKGGTGQSGGLPAQNMDAASHIDLTGMMELVSPLTPSEAPFTLMINAAADLANGSGDIKNLIQSKQANKPAPDSVWVGDFGNDTVTRSQMSNNKFWVNYQSNHATSGGKDSYLLVPKKR